MEYSVTFSIEYMHTLKEFLKVESITNNNKSKLKDNFKYNFIIE